MLLVWASVVALASVGVCGDDGSHEGAKGARAALDAARKVRAPRR
jgi:hypothetical protein